MSMIAYVSIVVKDYNILCSTLKEMNYTVNKKIEDFELQYLDLSGEYVADVNDINNRIICYIYKIGNEYKLISTIEENFNQSVVNEKKNLQRRIDLIQQNYAATEIMETAKINGWSTINREVVDGVIRIKLAV